MSETRGHFLAPAGQACRRVASVLIVGVWRRMTQAEVEARLKELAPRDQAVIVGGVLAALLGLCLFAAQFGIIGFLAFLLLVVLVVN